MKGDPAIDEVLLTQGRALMEMFGRGLNNYSADTLVELKTMLRPITGDEDGHGDRLLDRLMVRLQQSPRCDDEMREVIGRVRAFMDATPPKKLRGNRKVLEQARALASLAVYAATTPETAEPTAVETTAAEAETPTEEVAPIEEAAPIEAETTEVETAEVAPTEAAEDCDFCHEPGHSFNDCAYNRGPDAEKSGIETPTAETAE